MLLIGKWLWDHRRLVAYAVALLAVALLIGWFSHARYTAGEAAGEARVHKAWDIAKLAQQRAYDDAVAAVAAKRDADQKAAQEVENGLRESLTAATADGRTLSERVRMYQASLARCRAVPGAPPGANQPAGAGGEPGRDPAFERLSDDAWSACKRDAVRLDRIDQWAVSVGLQVKP